jgi:predicted naringenin-chalcone synthase
MSRITHLGTAVPKHKNEQASILEFMSKIGSEDTRDQRRTSLMYARSGIATRYSVVPDYVCALEDRVFFPNTNDLEPFPSIEKRMEFFDVNAIGLGLNAIENAFSGKDIPQDITHLITVSCTGLSAPGLDILLVKALGLPSDINRTSVNFMGCYAAIHALKQADVICKSQADAKVLIVLVELCTLHFQKEQTLDFITSNLLFGDGAACCLVENGERGFRIESAYSKLFLESQESMGWHLSSNGFLMSLKTEVPKLIEDNIAKFVETALSKIDLKKEDVANWAIHPGGRKILEVTVKSLGLKMDDLNISFDVLKNYGNMSSCTLIFILKEMLGKKSGNTFVAGFGPGITMESLILSQV